MTGLQKRSRTCVDAVDRVVKIDLDNLVMLTFSSSRSDSFVAFVLAWNIQHLESGHGFKFELRPVLDSRVPFKVWVMDNFLEEFISSS